MKNTLLYIVLLINALVFAQGNPVFEQANKAFDQGNYNEAIDAYQRLISNNKFVSPEIYFNLANAYYKTEKIAPSIYYYEKALALKPNDKAILANLALVEKMKIDKFDIIAQPFLTIIANAMTSFFRPDVWAYIAVSFSVLFLVFFVLYFLKRKQSFFIAFWISLGLIFYAYTAANYQNNKVLKNQFAVVFDKEVPLNKEPKLTAKTVVTIHEGEKIKILNTAKTWAEVQLSDGRTGWLPKESFRQL